MLEYHSVVKNTLEKGNYKKNRTGVDTISTFSQSYRIELQSGFPLLTTKNMSGFRWNSLIHELLWYLSGEHHIRNLQENTNIWDPWADNKGNLETAYGRFWRRHPIPDENSRLDGEAWPDENHKWVNREKGGRLTLDQIQYVIDTLNGNNPNKDHNSRRLVVCAWHPANAVYSNLPPCHHTWVVNVQDGKLNIHLTQRSGDIALGVPFNIAAYSLLTKIIAQQTEFEVGSFSHTIVDSHIYCGKDERGVWYRDNLESLKDRIQEVTTRDDYLAIREWILSEASSQEERYDHVPGLLKQLSREPRNLPNIEISNKPIEELEFEDFKLKEYNPHKGIEFEVAE